MTRRATDNTKALDAFLAAKTEIDAMLERLSALSADHFETGPEEIHWGHVGTLNHYRVSDIEAFEQEVIHSTADQRIAAS